MTATQVVAFAPDADTLYALWREDGAADLPTLNRSTLRVDVITRIETCLGRSVVSTRDTLPQGVFSATQVRDRLEVLKRGIETPASWYEFLKLVREDMTETEVDTILAHEILVDIMREHERHQWVMVVYV